MRRLAQYIHQQSNWPSFTWDDKALTLLLAEVRHRQGLLLGRMEGLEFPQQQAASLQMLTAEVLKTSEIEGELLDAQQVCSSIARRLGIEIAGLIPADRHVEGIVEMMLDATGRYSEPLTEERLCGWHAALFPAGRSGMHKITVGGWRARTADDPMQVVSGAMGRDVVHFEAPGADLLPAEMRQFLEWFNSSEAQDPVLKAAIAHLWFVTTHPFDDGNGRIARAIADMQLARGDSLAERFYSMSAQIRIERTAYYEVLEKTQKGSLDITEWMQWFLRCLQAALMASEETLAATLRRARFWQQWSRASLNARQQAMLDNLLDGFFGSLTSSKWAKMAKCSQDTAARDIAGLVAMGILVKSEAGGRSTKYDLVR